MKEKNLVSTINFKKYYNDFERDDNSYLYSVVIFLLKHNNLTYVGNRQVPTNVEMNDKLSDMEYWFNGDSNEFSIIYTYDNTSNSYYNSDLNICNKLYNQPLINVIKQDVIDVLKTNYNVQQLPKDYNVMTQFGKLKSDWKRNAFKLLNSMDVMKFKTLLSGICERIGCNSESEFWWYYVLSKKNRYWFISKDDDKYESKKKCGIDKLTNEELTLVVILKEYLFFYLHYYCYKLKLPFTVFASKVMSHSYNETLFNKVKEKKTWFTHRSQIELLCSAMYLKSTDFQIDSLYIKFMTFRKNAKSIIHTDL